MKKMTMNDVIAFIEKALKDRLTVYRSNNAISVTFEKKTINFIYSEEGILYIDTDNGDMRISLTEEDSLRWKILYCECDKYNRSRAIEDFNNFFKEENSKLKDINDLDNEDD